MFYILILLFFHLEVYHPIIHSFPTRRSSDLAYSSSRSCSFARHGASWRTTAPGRWLSRRALLASRTVKPRSRASAVRSEEHTSELQSPCNLVCRLLLEKKNDDILHLYL